MQGKQHQPDTHQHGADAAPTARCLLLHAYAGEDEQWRHPFYPGGDNPRRDRCTNIGAQQYNLRHALLDKFAFDKGSNHQCSGRGTLKTDRCNKPGCKGTESRTGAAREPGAQAGPERPLDAIFHLCQSNSSSATAPHRLIMTIVDSIKLLRQPSSDGSRDVAHRKSFNSVP